MSDYTLMNSIISILFDPHVRLVVFIYREDADEEANDPQVAYGQPPVPIREKIPLHEKKGLGRRKSPRGRRGKKGTAEESQFEDEDVKSKVFITQGEGGEGGDNKVDRGASLSGRERRESAGFGLDRPSQPGGSRQSNFGASKAEEPKDGFSPFNSQGQAGTGSYEGDDEFGNDSRGELYGGGKPPHTFMPLVQPALPPRGQEDNPVYSWHNQFVAVRQKGRDQLQRALYERAEGRHRARTQGKMAANLSGLIMLDLDAVHGRKVPYAGSSEPSNPYGRMDKTWNAMEETRKAKTQKALTLNPDELKGLQRFYDQLCALVESQEKMSDPICLMIVHRVRDLLESGTSLHKSLLGLVLDHVTAFVKGAGLVRFNRFLLPILTFVSRCSGVSDLDFEELVASHGIQIVIYGTADVPSVIEGKSRPPSQGLSQTRSNRQFVNKSKLTMRASNGGEGRGVREFESQSSLQSPSMLPQISMAKINKQASTSGTKKEEAGAPLSGRREKPATLKDVPSLVEGDEMSAGEKISLAFASSLGMF